MKIRLKIHLAALCLTIAYSGLAQVVDVKDGASTRVRIDPTNSASSGEIRTYDSDGTITNILAGGHGVEQGAYLNMYTGTGAHTIQLDAHHNGGGQFYLRNANGSLAVHAQAQSGSGFSSNDATFELHDDAGNIRVHLGASDGLFGVTGITTYQGDGSVATSMGTSVAGGGGYLNLMNGAGTAIVQFQATPVSGDFHLKVDGRMISEELRIANSNDWPDYVFEKDYALLSIDDLSSQIDQLGHLPNIPDAKTVEEEGISVGEMQKLHMEKIEELTLYIIQLHQRIKDLEADQ